MDSTAGANISTRILIVDDNPTMRETITLLIDDTEDLRVCGDAQCIADALEQCKALQPDLVLVDISLKGENGLDLIRHLVVSCPAVHSVVFSLHDERQYIEGAREAGAEGYALKNAGTKSLLATLRSVRDGNRSFPSSEQR